MYERINMMLETANEYLDRCKIYKSADDREYLQDDIERSYDAKEPLWEILSKCEGWNGRGQVVLPVKEKRDIDSENISNFVAYLRRKMREVFSEVAKIDGLTYDEMSIEYNRIRSYVEAFKRMRGVLETEVVVKGKDISEWTEVKSGIFDNLVRFDNEAKYFDGIYITQESHALIEVLESICKFINKYRDSVLSKEAADEINELFDVRAQEGAKMSRTIQKVLKKVGFLQKLNEDETKDFNRAYATYSDAINVLEIPRWFVISVNFTDYLSMSNGKSWTSCLSTDKSRVFTSGHYGDGFNSRRTLDYALDPSTIVCYTIDAKYDGDTPELEKKITRQLFHFGELKLIQGRLYPQMRTCRRETYTLYRNVVEKVIAEGLGEANLWSSPCRGSIDAFGNVFNTPYESSYCGDFIDFSSEACHGGGDDDADYFIDECNWVYLKGASDMERSYDPMIVGSVDALDIITGENLREEYHNAITRQNAYDRY